MATLPRRAALLAAITLARCSVLPERAYQERRQWPLDVPRPATLPSSPRAPALLIRGMQAAPGLDARGLRTLEANGAERRDFWEEWAVPPPQGVEESLRHWLAGCGVFSAVVRSGSDLPAPLVLEPELIAFEADLRAHMARASLSLVLLRRANGQAYPILQETVTGLAPLAAGDAAAIQAALRAALADLLGRVEAALRPAVG